jgi:hypothetical protein
MRKRNTLLAGAAAVVVALPAAAHAAPGDVWRPVTFLPIESINDFDGAGPAEVWHVATDYAIGEGAVPAIFRWTGGLTWERYSPPDIPSSARLTHVTVRSANDVWATGLMPTGEYATSGYTYLTHYDGYNWTRMQPPQPPVDVGYRELASDSAGVWLTEGGRISRWDGWSWTVVTSISRNVHRIEAFAPDNAWITADNTVWHWDGSSWQEVPNPGGTVRFDDGVAWAATVDGLKAWDGSAWQTTPYPAPFDGALKSAAGLADSDGRWVALETADGEKGLLHRDGSAWTRYPVMPNTTGQVVVDDAGRIWGVNRITRVVSTFPLGGYPQTKGQVVRFKNGAWENVGVAEAAYRLVHLPGGDRLYGAGENGWNGADRIVTNR